MKQLFIMRGLPGSGKSLISKILWFGLKMNGVTQCTLLSADDLRFYDGEYKFIPENEEFVWERFEELFYEAIDNEIENIIIDNTNLRPINYELYKREAIENGYAVHEIIVGDFDVVKCFERGKHDVPIDKLQAMKDFFQFPTNK